MLSFVLHFKAGTHASLVVLKLNTQPTTRATELSTQHLFYVVWETESKASCRPSTPLSYIPSPSHNQSWMLLIIGTRSHLSVDVTGTSTLGMPGDSSFRLWGLPFCLPRHCQTRKLLRELVCVPQTGWDVLPTGQRNKPERLCEQVTTLVIESPPSLLLTWQWNQIRTPQASVRPAEWTQHRPERGRTCVPGQA